MTKTVTIEGDSPLSSMNYVLASIKTGVGRKLRETAAQDFNVAFLAASLQAGGHADATIEWVDANIDFFGTPSPFNTLLTAAYEVNGFKVQKVGEKQPEAGPAPDATAESNSITSTAA
jgi:hypothetical protein